MPGSRHSLQPGSRRADRLDRGFVEHVLGERNAAGPGQVGSARKERYQKWHSGMDAALSDPIINPALLNTAAFVSTDSADPAYPAFDLWQQRTTWLGTLLIANHGTNERRFSRCRENKLLNFDDQVLSARC